MMSRFRYFLIFVWGSLLVSTCGFTLPNPPTTNQRGLLKHNSAVTSPASNPRRESAQTGHSPTSLHSTPSDYGFNKRSTSTLTATETSTEITDTEKPKSLMDRFDKWGLSLKPMALKAKSDAVASTQRWKSYLFTSKFCGILCLFIAYRAYRGFFIILPQVFREVERKLSLTMNYAPFIDDDISTVTNKIDARIRGNPDSSDSALAEDVDPKTGMIRPRTTITVTLLAAMVTACYMVRGALGVIYSLLKTGALKRDIREGFEAAADEVIANEERIMRVVGHKKQQIE